MPASSTSSILPPPATASPPPPSRRTRRTACQAGGTGITIITANSSTSASSSSVVPARRPAPAAGGGERNSLASAFVLPPSLRPFPSSRTIRHTRCKERCAAVFRRGVVRDWGSHKKNRPASGIEGRERGRGAKTPPVGPSVGAADDAGSTLSAAAAAPPHSRQNLPPCPAVRPGTLPAPGSPFPPPQSVSRVLLQSCLSFAYFFVDYVEEEEEEE